MGLFEKLFGRAPAPTGTNGGYFKLLNGYSPVFSSWNGQLYESERVRAAIDARARHASKLAVSITGGAKPSLQAKLRLGPNEWQTWAQFLYRLSTILDAKNTAFITPVFNEFGEMAGVASVLTERYELIDYGGRPWIRMAFANGKTAAIELDRVGILTKHQYTSDFFGESNASLRPTMELINIQNQGITTGVKNAASYQFMAEMSNLAKSEDIAKERKRFTRDNLEAKDGGILLFPSTYKNVKQIDSKPFVVDADQMKLINENVNNYFGVNEAVLQNKAIGDAWSAFYEGAIEPFSVQLAEVLTKMLFSVRERELGNRVDVTSNRLQYMSNQDKLNVSAQLMDRGLLTLNEAREIWNLPPIENGDNRVIRGEYYNADEKITEESNE